jgi:hypothetical protein
VPFLNVALGYQFPNLKREGSLPEKGRASFTLFRCFPMVRTRIQLDDELFCWDVVPSWERHFGVHFAHDAFAHATTVGQVWAVVEQRLVAQLGEPMPSLTAACATQRTFYHLRRTLVAQGVARATITPRLALATLFPWRDRPQQWRQWQQVSQLPLPALRTPMAVFGALWAGTTAAVWSLIPGWGLALALGLCAALVGNQVEFGRRALPASTLAELTRRLVTTQYGVLLHPAMRNNRGEWRDVVLTGLARCGAEAENLNQDELYDGTVISW